MVNSKFHMTKLLVVNLLAVNLLASSNLDLYNSYSWWNYTVNKLSCWAEFLPPSQPLVSSSDCLKKLGHRHIVHMVILLLGLPNRVSLSIDHDNGIHRYYRLMYTRFESDDVMPLAQYINPWAIFVSLFWKLWCIKKAKTMVERVRLELIAAVTKGLSTLNPIQTGSVTELPNANFQCHRWRPHCIVLNEFTFTRWLQVATPPHSYPCTLVRSVLQLASLQSWNKGTVKRYAILYTCCSYAISYVF